MIRNEPLAIAWVPWNPATARDDGPADARPADGIAIVVHRGLG